MISDIVWHCLTLFDRSWSINEIRAVIVNTHELPLKWDAFEQFYETIFSCCNESDAYVCSQLNTNANISQHFQRGLESYEVLIGIAYAL